VSMTRSGEGRSRWLLIGAALVVGLLLLVGTWWLFTQGPGAALLSPPGSTVASFSGEGNQTTDSFSVREGWSIQWQSEGQSFSYAIRGDRDFGTVITVDEPTSGVTNPTGSGTYHLEITAEGAWQVDVIQGD
jgi:hypothetical protein